ncbi:hypothetical protein KCP73_25965 [Salmonella enterica subsp. enterica]|nr:hypothetical protein KCP73_25965 [Salmonella enterica subsp. enterica]
MGGPAQNYYARFDCDACRTFRRYHGAVSVLKHIFARVTSAQPPALDKLWIDIGRKDKADAERMALFRWGRQ